MNIPILFEDESLMVVDKPAGITVNRSETTIHETTVQDSIETMWGTDFIQKASEYLALKKERTEGMPWDPTIDFYTRCGIVHRLDKETSGCLLVAKNPQVFALLQDLFKQREVKKTYRALAHGKISPSKGEINVPVGRLPWNRNRFGILPGGRESKTEYALVTYYEDSKNHEILSYLELFPLTGRTHQIRVHLQYLGHPIFSDFLYAGRKTQRADRKKLNRVFLHAASISFKHPVTKDMVVVTSPLPLELATVLSGLTVIEG